jgi:vacuolar protein sorting-associated protein 45
VYLVETLEAPHNNMTHMAAVCLLRPVPENIRALLAHLKEPKFKEYHIFFTNIVTQDLLRKLADADHLQVVKQVQEYYADFYAVNPELFSLNLSGSLSLSRPRSAYSVHETAALSRSMQGLLAALLSLKMKPYVRFQASSEAAQVVAREITGSIAGERDLFTFQRQAGAPLLLVLDRRDDPVTPLLSQWTYQAMVHELLPGGIKNNTVDMRHAKGVSKDLECVLEGCCFPWRRAVVVAAAAAGRSTP